MGILFVNDDENKLILKSTFYFYGNLASTELARQVAYDCYRYWNEPEVTFNLFNKKYLLRFDIEGYYKPTITAEEINANTNPANNFFRVEEHSNLHVSFVDGINSNTGYFKLANLLHTGSTAAHEYGHTLGLEHPPVLDIRGKGIPGIMYPRGTIVDAHYQYNPQGNAGDSTNGGTMNPIHRRVMDYDIAALKLHEFNIQKNKPITIGNFSNVYHLMHEKPDE
jgi:hypothetical protein